MTNSEILTAAKEELAKKYGYTSWGALIQDNHGTNSIYKAANEAALLAMERIEKETWNKAIDAAAENARILFKEIDEKEPLGYSSILLTSWECYPNHVEVSKLSILKLKK